MNGSPEPADDAAPGGLRERHKQRTRQALIDAATTLFERHGYEATTVAQIAAAAGVSTKTFFNYFASKDEVLYANPQTRLDAAVAVISGHADGEPMTTVLVRAVEVMLGLAGDDLTTGRSGLRLRLLTSVPSLQAGALHRIGRANAQLARALAGAYPHLSPDEAAVAVGTLLGAVLAATVTSVGRGDPPGAVLAAVRDATRIALHGLYHLDGPAEATSARVATAGPGA